LLSAACNGHWRICKLLLKNNVDCTISSFNNSSALHYLAKHIPQQADRNGYQKVFQKLLKSGASVLANRAGDTPLHAACSVGNAVAVQVGARSFARVTVPFLSVVAKSWANVCQCTQQRRLVLTRVCACLH
jgi:ankyrin repeat protein